jgi:hypothetical protein
MNMTLNKRFFLITTMALVIFAAIAVGPAYRRTVSADHARSAVVVLTCTDVDGRGLEYATSSDPDVTLPAADTPCATALQDIVSQGFSILPAVAGTGPVAGVNASVFVWTLVHTPH